jgi:hypothetical protein
MLKEIARATGKAVVQGPERVSAKRGVRKKRKSLSNEAQHPPSAFRRGFLNHGDYRGTKIH